jgi:hypothetical protein
VSTPNSGDKKFTVTFFVNNNLHSKFDVAVDHVKNAVGAAIDAAKEIGEDVSRLSAAITLPNGHGVEGVDDLQTKSQLQAQLKALQDQLNRLEPDEQTVSDNVPNVSRNVSPPPVPTPTFTGPDPSTSGVSAGTPVEASSAPVVNTPVSQAEIDAALAKRDADAGPVQG